MREHSEESFESEVERLAHLLRLGRLREALLVGHRLLARDPENASALGLMAQIQADLGDDKAAQAMAKRLLALAPDSPWALRVQSLIHLKGGRPKLAAEFARNALSLDPNDCRSYELLARTEAVQARWDRAMELAARGLEVDPEDTGCGAFYCLSALRVGKLPLAQDMAERLIARDPDHAVSHRLLGMTLLCQNKPEEAEHHLKEALRQDPEDIIARDAYLLTLRSRSRLYRLFLPGLAREQIQEKDNDYAWLYFAAVLAGMGTMVVGRVIALDEGAPGLALGFQVGEGLLFAVLILLLYMGPLLNLRLGFDLFGHAPLTEADARNARRWVAVGVAGVGLIVLAFVLHQRWPALFGLPLLLCAALARLWLFQETPARRAFLVVWMIASVVVGECLLLLGPLARALQSHGIDRSESAPFLIVLGAAVLLPALVPWTPGRRRLGL